MQYAFNLKIEGSEIYCICFYFYIGFINFSNLYLFLTKCLYVTSKYLQLYCTLLYLPFHTFTCTLNNNTYNIYIKSLLESFSQDFLNWLTSLCLVWFIYLLFRNNKFSILWESFMSKHRTIYSLLCNIICSSLTKLFNKPDFHIMLFKKYIIFIEMLSTHEVRLIHMLYKHVWRKEKNYCSIGKEIKKGSS